MEPPMLATQGPGHTLGDWHPARRPDTNEVVNGIQKHSDVSKADSVLEKDSDDHQNNQDAVMAPELSSTPAGSAQAYFEREPSPVDRQRGSPKSAKVSNHAVLGDQSGLVRNEQQPLKLQHGVTIGDTTRSPLDEQLNGSDSEVLPNKGQNDTIFEAQGSEKHPSDAAASEWFWSSSAPTKTTWDEVAGNDDLAALSTYN
ncbi:MAG: hypothetical protein Q9191_008505, partial [Dirinaria sp. TL-2023a]